MSVCSYECGVQCLSMFFCVLCVCVCVLCMCVYCFFMCVCAKLCVGLWMNEDLVCLCERVRM